MEGMAEAVRDTDTPEDAVASIEEPVSLSSTIPAHLFNDIHPWYVRYGIPLYLTSIFGLLLASDLGSGVSAETTVSVDGQVIFHSVILTVSIFSSVSELRKTESYPLAVLIVITSIMWPYIKLALSMYAWVAPPLKRGGRGGRRRERLIEVLDVLGKWSFTDIFVLMIMVVAFRSTLALGQTSTDVYIVPKWGFYGFVFASVASLLSTHLILHLHRKVIYPELYSNKGANNRGVSNKDDDSKVLVLPEAEFDNTDVVVADKDDAIAPLWIKMGLSFKEALSIVLLLFIAFALLGTGCFLTSFTFTYEQGDPSSSAYLYNTRDFSIANIGFNVRNAAISPNSFGIGFVQFFYFVLAVVTPLENIVVLFVLYFVPMKDRIQRMLFFLAEITFAWGAVEVMMISAIFSVKQIPDFGSGIVDTGCSTCYVVGAILRPTFWIYFVGAILNVFVTFWLFHRAHKHLYNDEKFFAKPSKCCWC